MRVCVNIFKMLKKLLKIPYQIGPKRLGAIVQNYDLSRSLALSNSGPIDKMSL